MRWTISECRVPRLWGINWFWKLWDDLLCSPVLVPQIVGGGLNPGEVTINWSWMHWVAVETGMLALIIVAAVVSGKWQIISIDVQTTTSLLKITCVWTIQYKRLKVQSKLTDVVITLADFGPTCSDLWNSKIIFIDYSSIMYKIEIPHSYRFQQTGNMYSFHLTALRILV